MKADTVRATSSGPRGPLTGLRVLELADEKAQYCGKLMADLGADVIKIEPPDGEAIRGLGPFLEDTPHRDRSLSFWHYNTSKRGITLNLETEDGRRLFQRLASTADIVLESFKPGYLPSLGLGYEELKKLNPRLIMCSLTSFGQTGPWRDYIACDLVHLAAGGQMGCCGYDEGELPDAPPIAGGGGQPWHAAAHYAYIAISAALYHRDMTGRGQYIDASVHEACAITTENLITGYTYRGEIVRRQTGRHASYDETERTQFRCKDGLYMNGFLGGRLTAHRIGILAEWMDSHGLADDLTDEKYRDPAVFQENLLHINEVIINFIANLTSDELYHGSQERGLAWGKVRAPDDLIDDEHLNDRGFWVEVEHPELGRTFKYPGASAIFNAGPWRISRRAPLVGEHNEEVYCGELGLQRTELASLGEAGVT